MNTTTKTNTNPAKVVTGEVRFSYLNAFKPRSINGSPEKYSVCLIIPKSDKETIKKINTAVLHVYETSMDILRGSARENPELDSLLLPVHDGDKERPGEELYSNAWYINASTRFAPDIVDAHCKPITNPNELYSGCYGRASVVFRAYNGFNRGISCTLQNLQKLHDGEPLGGRSSAAADFGVFTADDEEEALPF